MKPANFIKITSIALLSSFLFQSAKAQEFTRKQADSAQHARAQNVFIELGGAGILFSANYDTRFSNRRDGLGARIGIGFDSADGVSFTSVPIQINYLLGKNGKYFEIGAGGAYTNFDINSGFLSLDDEQFNKSSFLGTMTFGYRSQPIDGGFNFRASFNPLFTSKLFIPSAGISFGYTF